MHVFDRKMTSYKTQIFGTVLCIDGRNVKVLVARTSGCSSCEVASSCSKAGSREITVNAYNDSESDLKIGSHVCVVMDSKSGLKAVLLGFGLPLVVLLITFGLCSALYISEMTACLLSLLSVLGYYAVLFLFRTALSRNFIMEIADNTKCDL